MPRTALTLQTFPGETDIDGVAPTWEATDASNDNFVVYNRPVVIFARNDNAGPQTLTVVSVADELNRTRDALLAMASGAYRVFGPFRNKGWRQTGGQLWIDSTHAEIVVAVFAIPDINPN